MEFNNKRNASDFMIRIRGMLKNWVWVVFMFSGLIACENDDSMQPDSPHEERPDELGPSDLIDNSDEFAYGATNGMIDFSGYQWDVKSSVTNAIGPGPNYFSMNSQNVWVDKKGSLHLEINHRNDRWYSSSVSLPRPRGFGKYMIYVSSKTEELDPNIVVGFFLYKSDSQEVDIELSRWAREDNKNAQFAIQPADRQGNKKRFDVLTEGYKTTYFIDWQRDSIVFGGFKGVTLNPKEENIFSSWTYQGKDIPTDEEEKFIINFWLFRGNPPFNNQDAEIVIDSVRVIEYEK